jgi:hypothetical protein
MPIMSLLRLPALITGGLPKKALQEMLKGSHQQLGDMIALIRAKLEDQ